ncbi:ABC transporter permease [Hominifimenecus sp. rT4P-3]|uniref:ABC transporter permease n=1 Tax=Hominifimenecus sp. rT4P-3 TaxID=3242979 RepID=UPI003DA4B63C
MLENISLAFQGIWGHKLRSFLTMLGIIIGIASIISIVSTIKGTNDQIKQNLIGAGTNAVKVQLYQGDGTFDVAYNTIPEGVNPLSEDTRAELEALDEVEKASFYTKRDYSGNVFHKNQAFTGTLLGIDENYFDVYGYYVQVGRNFTEEDFGSFQKVAIVDRMAISALFSGDNPVGKTLEINGEPYTVVGVVDQSSQFEPVINDIGDYNLYMNNSSGAVFIPGSTWPIVFQFDEPQTVALKAAGTDAMTNAGKKAADILTGTLNASSELKMSYKSEDLLEQAKQLQELSTSTNQQLIWIASISLLVGGIGVMNIMLVSVTERTSEIGLKKAIGARKSRILIQFLTEAAVLTSLGGLVGVGAGIVMAKVVSGVAGTPAAISVPATLIAVAFSMIIGLIFGLIPAVKASNLNPIEALRRE